MNEQTGKTPSSLAIMEKKPHRSGGCIGIFFQLFDWNKRFAKKNLFSRKALPPGKFFFLYFFPLFFLIEFVTKCHCFSARTKASKSFGGDEKMPKSKQHLVCSWKFIRFFFVYFSS